MKGDIIPNGEILYRYIKPGSFPDDQKEIPFTIFEDKNLSCDWAKYQLSPEESYHIKEGKNLIIQIYICEDIKFPSNPKRPLAKPIKEWEQKVVHVPQQKGEVLTHPEIENLSHSQIEGIKKIAITTVISQNSKRYKLISA